MSAKDVYKEAKSAGITDRTLERAKAQLGVRSRKLGRDAGSAHWAWTLPEERQSGDLGDLPISGSSAGNPGTSPRSPHGDVPRVTEYI
jgi:hypothetical protein